MKIISILLAEDHAFVREGFRKMLELEPDFAVVGEAQNGRHAVTLSLELCPDIILMDIAMPMMNGLEATRQVLKVQPSTKILILSAHNDDAYIKSAMESGAAGFLLKQTSAHNVCVAIRKVIKGEPAFSSMVSKRLTRLTPLSSSLRIATRKRTTKLTSRETEVLQLIAEGKTNKGTASELGISIKTVEKHRGQLMHKLDIHDTASLTRYAISTGIIENSVTMTT